MFYKGAVQPPDPQTYTDPSANLAAETQERALLKICLDSNGSMGLRCCRFILLKSDWCFATNRKHIFLMSLGAFILHRCLNHAFSVLVNQRIIAVGLCRKGRGDALRWEYAEFNDWQKGRVRSLSVWDFTCMLNEKQDLGFRWFHMMRSIYKDSISPLLLFLPWHSGEDGSFLPEIIPY